MTMGMPEWALEIPSAPVHQEQSNQLVRPFTAQQLIEFGLQLIEQFIKRVVLALAGFFIPGVPSFEQLVAWADDLREKLADIPILGDIIEAITGVEDGDLNDLGTFFLNIRSFLAGINFLDPDFDLGEAAAAFVNLIIKPLNIFSIPADVQASINGALGDLQDALNGSYSGSGPIFLAVQELAKAWLTATSPLKAKNLTGTIPPWLLGPLSAASLVSSKVNLLANAEFEGAVSVDGGGVWHWDAEQGRTDPGSAWTTADGTLKVLASNPIGVSPGQKIVGADGVSAPSVWVRTSSYAGSGTPLRFMVREYFSGAVVNDRVLAQRGGSDGVWSKLSAAYTVPSGVDQIRFRLVVDSGATGGGVGFDDGDAWLAGNGPFDGILAMLNLSNLSDLFNLDAAVRWADVITNLMNPLEVIEDRPNRTKTQGVIEAAISAFLGDIAEGVEHTTADLEDAFTKIPADKVLGLQGFPTLQDTFQKTLDALKTGLGLAPQSDANLDEVQSAAEFVALKSNQALGLAQSVNAVLNIRDNQPVSRGISAISEPNFDFATIPNKVTNTVVDINNPDFLPVNATTAPMAFVRTRGGGTKGAVMWFGKGNTDITSFIINLYAVNLSSGALTKFHTSADIKAQLDADWRFESYTMPDAARFTPEAGDVIAVEWVLTGSGTYQIAGNSAAWRSSNHPYAIPARLGASRNPTGNASPATISGGSVGYVSSFAWFSLEETEIPGNTEGDVSQTFAEPGTYAFDFELAHKYVDYVLIGGGGGGESSQAARGGYAGLPGTWVYGTLERGVDFPSDVTRIYVTVGAGGPALFVWYLQGNPGSPTSITYPNLSNVDTQIKAAGGMGGGRPGNPNHTGTGPSPGNITFRGVEYFGGAEAVVNQNGFAPGGAAGGSIYATTGPGGGDGRAWLVAREL
ncbi:hypothetical protein [Mycolicibacterium fortuitum]|nr:hypothetical protein [Mycolicibacterium fortuitum]